MSKMWQPQPCGCGCPFGSKNLDHLDNDLLILPHGVGKASVHMSEAKCSDKVILFLLDQDLAGQLSCTTKLLKYY